MENDAITEIENRIRSSKELVDFSKSVERLNTNRDFKKVILEGYFEKEAIRLVRVKAEPAMQNPASQAHIISAMDAIGNLYQYLMDATRTGDLALKDIADNEEVRDEILSGELNDE